MKESIKKAIFLALTKVHRDIKNEKPVNWYPTFKECGISNPNIARDIKNALITMKVIKCYPKHRIGWNKEKTVPSMALIEGIELTLKESKKVSKNTTKKEVPFIEIEGYDPKGISCTLWV
jgi:hypothetical protein